MEEPDKRQRRLVARQEWEQLKPLLYDQFSQQQFSSPSNTVDFLPGWYARGGGWGHQQLVTACQKEDGLMQLRFLQIPVMEDPVKAEANPIHRNIIDFDMPLFSDIFRVRHMPQVPSLMAVNGPEGVVLIRSPQAELSITNQADGESINTSRDATEIEEGMEDDYVAWFVGRFENHYAAAPEDPLSLAWSPGSVGSLLSINPLGTITLYRVDVDDSQVDAAAPGYSESLATIGRAEQFARLPTDGDSGLNDVAWVPNQGPGAPHTFSSVGEDGKLTCWDLRAGRAPVGGCYVHHGAANTLTYSNHDPHILVTGGADGNLSVLDMRCTSSSNSNAASTSAGRWTPKCHLHTRIPSHKCNIEQASFSPHHRGLLAACDVSGRVMLWNIHATKGNGYLKPKQKRFIHHGHMSPVLDVSWSLCEGPPLIATVSEAYYDEEELQQPHILQVWAPNQDFL